MKKFAITIFRLVLLTGLLISPLVYWPHTYIAFEIPKAWFILRWIEVLAVLVIVFYPYLVVKEKRGTKIAALVVIYFLLALLSSFVGSDLQKSIWGNYYRLDGIFTLSHLLILFFIVYLFVDRKLLREIKIAIGTGVLFLSGWVFIQGIMFWFYKSGSVINWQGALGGPFGNPNFLAGFLIVTLPLLFHLRNSKEKFRSWIWTIAVILSVMVILLTQSRAVFALLALTILFVLTQKRKLTAKLILIVMTVMILFASAYINLYLSKPHAFVAEGRTRIFTKGFLGYLKRPLLGWGWANFDNAFDSVDWPIKIENDVYVDKAHSSILENLVTLGSIGFIVYLLLIYRVGRKLYQDKGLRKPFFFMFVILIVHSQTNVISVSEELLFWLMAGIAAGVKTTPS